MDLIVTSILKTMGTMKLGEIAQASSVEKTKRVEVKLHGAVKIKTKKKRRNYRVYAVVNHFKWCKEAK